MDVPSSTFNGLSEPGSNNEVTSLEDINIEVNHPSPKTEDHVASISAEGTSFDPSTVGVNERAIDVPMVENGKSLCIMLVI